MLEASSVDAPPPVVAISAPTTRWLTHRSDGAYGQEACEHRVNDFQQHSEMCGTVNYILVHPLDVPMRSCAIHPLIDEDRRLSVKQPLRAVRRFGWRGEAWWHSASIALASFVATGVVLGLSAPITSAHEPGSPLPIPLCKSWGGSSVAIYDVSVPANATNTTPTWRESPGGLGTIFYWGNSTAYKYPKLNATVTHSFANGSASYAVGNSTVPDVDYLKPTTKYYFEIYVGPLPAGYCSPGPWTYSGSWTAGSDATNSVTGTVIGATGGAPPASSLVYEECVTSTGSVLGSSEGYTSAGGFFSIVPKWTASECSTLDVSYCDGCSGYSQIPIWLKHWNLTLDLYAAGYYVLDVPVTVLSPLNPLVLDFTNDPYVTMQYEQGLMTTSTGCSTILGQQQCSSTTTGDITNLSTANNPGANMTYWGASPIAGTVVFSAVNGRTASVTSWAYASGPTSTSDRPTQDWLTPFFDTTNFTTGPEDCYQGFPGQAAMSYATTYAESYQLTSSFDLSISFSLPLPGGISVSTPTIGYSNSISSGGSRSWTFTYTIYVPSTGNTTNVWVYAQPGTTSQVGPVVHLWSGPSCPT